MCHRPFTIDVGGVMWSVAVGGAWIFAVRGTSSFKPMEGVSPLVPGFLSAEPSRGQEVETRKLKEWCGPPPTERTFTTDDRPEGVVLGRVIDQRRLACLLEFVPFPKLVLWDVTDLVGGVPAIGLAAKGKWRAVLAGIDTEPDEEHGVFDLRPEGAAAFDLMSQLTED